MSNIIVGSHRRSGTHLSIDTIVNNFSQYAKSPHVKDLTLDHLSDHVIDKEYPVSKLIKYLKNNNNVMKTHSHGRYADFFKGEGVDNQICEIFNDSRKIYIYRDGRDVMVSMYNYMMKFNKTIESLSFSEFIRMKNEFDAESYNSTMNRVEYWAYHINTWREVDDVLWLKYDEFKSNLEEALSKVAKHIDQPVPDCIVDIRRENESFTQKWVKRLTNKVLPDRFKKTRLTSVQFNKGGVGGWQSYFSDEDLDYFNKYAAVTNRFLGYE